MRIPRVLCNIHVHGNVHGNSPSGLRPRARARACIFHKTLGLMLHVYLLHTISKVHAYYHI